MQISQTALSLLSAIADFNFRIMALTIILFTIVLIVFINVALHCFFIESTVRISYLHYIASLIGPLTTLIYFNSSVFYGRNHVFWDAWLFFVVFGYIIGWIEIGVLKVFGFACKLICGGKTVQFLSTFPWLKVFSQKLHKKDPVSTDETRSKMAVFSMLIIIAIFYSVSFFCFRSSRFCNNRIYHQLYYIYVHKSGTTTVFYRFYSPMFAIDKLLTGRSYVTKYPRSPKKGII